MSVCLFVPGARGDSLLRRGGLFVYRNELMTKVESFDLAVLGAERLNV